MLAGLPSGSTWAADRGGDRACPLGVGCVRALDLYPDPSPKFPNFETQVNLIFMPALKVVGSLSTPYGYIRFQRVESIWKVVPKLW